MPRLSAIRKRALDEIMKEALFEATVAVLSKHGVDGLTMDRVASEAGMAKGSLYRYFRSKRELLEFVYAKLVDPLVHDMEQMAATEQPAMEKLAGQLRTLLEHVAQHAEIHRLLFEDDAARSLLQPSERRLVAVASESLSGIFRQGIAEGAFRPGDPFMFAHMYLGLCRGVLQSRPELGGQDQRESIHRLIMGTFLEGIALEGTRVGGPA